VNKSRRSKIDLPDNHVAKHCIKTFGKSRKEIEAAVGTVADNSDAVEKELGVSQISISLKLSTK
jgi:hypothetical protein